MKAALNIGPEEFVKAENLYAMACRRFPKLRSFSEDDLKNFRYKRNDVAHHGFSFRDEEETATLLLKTGYPFLSACYREFFDFSLRDGLIIEFGEQLDIALSVYTKAKETPGFLPSNCFSAFGHLIRWSVRQSLMPVWENEVAIHADEVGAKFNYCGKRKQEIEYALNTTWTFNCPVCDEIETFVCELDEEQLDGHVISLKMGVCVNCELIIPAGNSFLANALCRDQIEESRAKILLDFGIISQEKFPPSK
ncbi:MAG: hypothetical protein WC047_07035 [Kiritimatiellales bacterium]